MQYSTCITLCVCVGGGAPAFPTHAIETIVLGALVVTHAMLRRLISWRCIIIIIRVRVG